MVQLATNIFGVFAIRDGKIIERILFPQNSEEIAKRLKEARKSVCEEEIQLVRKLKKSGVGEISVENPGRFLKQDLGVEFIHKRSSLKLGNIAENLGIGRKEYVSLLSKVNLELAKKELQRVEKDRLIIQSIASLDEIEQSINILLERIREWYSLGFPELGWMIKNGEKYCKAISSGFKEMDTGLKKNILDARKDSLGFEFSRKDQKVVREMSNTILDLYSTQKNIEEYLGNLMQEVAPNLSELAGPILGARLISLAGSLERLSILPASTIQVLGAEDAFFRFLRDGKRPPKHGVIFQLPEIRSAKKKIRGKLSRTFATKLAIAARVDFFKGKFVADKLRKEFLEKVRGMR